MVADIPPEKHTQNRPAEIRYSAGKKLQNCIRRRTVLHQRQGDMPLSHQTEQQQVRHPVGYIQYEQYPSRHGDDKGNDCHGQHRGHTNGYVPTRCNGRISNQHQGETDTCKHRTVQTGHRRNANQSGLPSKARTSAVSPMRIPDTSRFRMTATTALHSVYVVSNPCQ